MVQRTIGMRSRVLTASERPEDGVMAAWPTRPGQAGNAPGIRHELVERVRQEIAAGTYDTQEKWEAALDRLLERLESA